MVYFFSYQLFTIYKIFLTLGNDRPKILVKLEDCVLQAIFDISEGMSTEPVIDALFLKIESLQDDLGKDDEALKWFDLYRPAFSTPLTPPPSELRPTPLAGQSIHYDFNHLSNDFPYDRRTRLSSTVMSQLSCLTHHITIRIMLGFFFTFTSGQAQRPP
jgi:hypothetical protein